MYPTQHRTVAADDVLVVQYRPAWKEQAFLRFSRIPHRVENCAWPEVAGDSPTVLTANEKNTTTQLSTKNTRAPLDSIDITSGDLPKIFDRHNVASSAHTLSYMSTHLCDLDVDLSQNQRAQVVAFTTLVEKTLNVILLQSQWISWTGKDWNDPNACSDASTNDIYSAMKSHHVFPFDRIVAFREKNKAQAIVHQHRLPCATLAKEQLHEGYRALETLLTASSLTSTSSSSSSPSPALASISSSTAGPYMFGRTTPCSLDAVVFGHIATSRSDKASEFGLEIELKFPKLWNHFEVVRSTFFARAMTANESNNFYRLGEHARARRRKQMREESIAAAASSSNPDDNSNSSETNQIVDSSSSASTSNSQHNGGGNTLYLPKASRSPGRVGTFSGRTPSKLRKMKNEKKDTDKNQTEKKKTKAELQEDYQNKVFLGCCSAVVVGYLFWSGRVTFADVDEY